MKKILSLIFIFFFKIACAEDIYNVEYISFGTNFFTPTTYENFHIRLEKKFTISHKLISNLVLQSKAKCKLKAIENEPRVILKKRDSIILMINVEKTFVTRLNLCSFDKDLEKNAIELIEKKAAKTKGR